MERSPEPLVQEFVIDDEQESIFPTKKKSSSLEKNSKQEK